MRFPELELYGIIPSNITSATVKVRDLMCYGFTLQVDCYGYGGTLPTGSFTTANMTWSAVYIRIPAVLGGAVNRSETI